MYVVDIILVYKNRINEEEILNTTNNKDEILISSSPQKLTNQ